jgi:Ca2+-binding EF-hand superfamily protein
MENNKLRSVGMGLALAGAFFFSWSVQAGVGMTDFEILDRNGDGKLSREEQRENAREMFEAMDANKDGSVTAAELETAHQQISGRQGQKDQKDRMSVAEMIAVIDTNDDGKISAEEHEAGAKRMFEMLDMDKDGAVTSAEMTASHKRLMKTTSKR